jgi:NAD(P)-dependent dehydrogenase (short-subunit alcohol dehydrogenase family)
MLPYRPRGPTRQERLDALAERLGHPCGLVGLVGDVEDETGAARLRAEVEAAVGAPDIVVASVGEWRPGPPLAETSLQVWREVVEVNLLPHVVAAATFLPALAGRAGAR